MEIALVGINSKYVHTNLAVRKIRAYLEAKGIPADVKEYSGSEELHRVAADILQKHYDCIGFSCYIWNISYVKKLAEIIKTASPETKLVFGGPEAEFSAEKILGETFADAVIKGEGETVFEDIVNGRFEKIMTGTPLDMEQMPFPYQKEELLEKNRIFYYESSRGCPFGCSYCLSSAEKGIRYKSVRSVTDDLKIFAANNVRLVKFIDRTFNSNLKRSKEILREILKLRCDTEFHIEIAADTVDDEFISILSELPEGKLRIEAGLQSTNPETLVAVNRKCNLEKLAKNIKNIIENTKVTLHLDLIAGLPNEDMQSFEKSFNFAYGLHPHELQLGFLKVLPGTDIAKNAGKFGIKNTSYPPYEIISNNDMSFEDLSALKDIEAVLDMYYNSGILRKTENILISGKNPFEFYKKLAEYFRANKLLGAPHHRIKLFDFMHEFAKNEGFVQFEEYLAQDYFFACKGAPVPLWAATDKVKLSKEIINEILADDAGLCEMDEFVKIEKRARHKHTRIEEVFEKVWLISYPDRKIADITENFKN